MSTREITEKIQTPGGFLQFQLRDLIMLLMAGVAIYSFFAARESGAAAQSEQMKQLRDTTAANSANLGTLINQVTNIDKKGTEHENQTLQYLNAKDTEHDRRLTNMEAELQQLVPDVREITTRIKFVADLLDERTKAKR